MAKLTSLFTSRRFLAAVAGVLAVVLQDTLGISETQSLQVMGMLSAWIVGDSLKNTQ